MDSPLAATPSLSSSSVINLLILCRAKLSMELLQ